MILKKIVSIAAILLLGINTVTAQKTSLKMGETLRPGEALFSKNGKWVLFMENSASSGMFGQFGIFATSNFSMDRNKKILASKPKEKLGKFTNKEQKLALVFLATQTIMFFYDNATDKYVDALVIGPKNTELRIKDDGKLEYKAAQ